MGVVVQSGVNITWQDAVAPLPDGVHELALRLPVPVHVTVSPGVSGVLTLRSPTVAVQSQLGSARGSGRS